MNTDIINAPSIKALYARVLLPEAEGSRLFRDFKEQLVCLPHINVIILRCFHPKFSQFKAYWSLTRSATSSSNEVRYFLVYREGDLWSDSEEIIPKTSLNCEVFCAAGANALKARSLRVCGELGGRATPHRWPMLVPPFGAPERRP